MGTGPEPQAVDLLLDTGSFELWVNPDCAKSNEPDMCRAFGSYNPSKSPTAKTAEESFAVQYGSGQTSGKYYTDDISIAGIQIHDQKFGVANASDMVWFGIMGLGREIKGDGFLEYPLMMDSIVEQGRRCD